MGGQRLELVATVDLQSTLDKVQAEQRLDFAEYSLLRESADAKLYLLITTLHKRQALAPSMPFEGEGDLLRLQDASVCLAQLLQSSCLTLRRLTLEPQTRRLAREALEQQLAYVQASLRRSIASLGEP